MDSTESKNDGWEKKLLENLAASSLKEQQRTRRWGIFFKALTFSYLFLLLFVALGWVGDMRVPKSGTHTALIDIDGMIAADALSSADNINASLRSAFKDKNTKGIILRINSPGGSPVQSDYINDEIHRLRNKYPDIPVYAVIEDICASGGYYIAVAADKIFVNQASLVGSIGVLMDGFGFAGALEKLGIERRLLTAGKNKGFLDPFSPADPEQKEHAQKLLGEIHNQFIHVVKEGRGDRLKEVPDMFSGMIWTGQKSIDLGLTDQMGSADYVAREIIKAETIVEFTAKEGFPELFVKRFSEAFFNVFMTNSMSLK